MSMEPEVTPPAESSTALTPIQRAAVALNSTENERRLQTLAQASVSITEIRDKVSYDQCHSARMTLKRTRVDIQNIGDDAREDANAFRNAVIAEQKRLVAIISPEEARLDALQTEYDRKKDEEKRAQAEAERRRIANIESRIEELRERILQVQGLSSAEILKAIHAVDAIAIDESFAEFKERAEGAKATCLIRLRTLHTVAEVREADDRRRAEERAELDRRRIAQEAEQAAERERLRVEEAAAALNRDRLSEIQGIQQQVIIASLGRAGVRKGGTIECIRETLAETERWPVTEEHFGLFTQSARNAKDSALERIRELLRQAETQAAERAEADRIEAQRRADGEAEQKRLDEQRGQLEREQAALRADQERAAIQAARAAPPELQRPPESTPFEQTVQSAQISAPFRPSDDEIVQAVAIAFFVTEGTAEDWLLNMDMHKKRSAA